MRDSAQRAQYHTDSISTPQSAQQARPHWMQPSASKVCGTVDPHVLHGGAITSPFSYRQRLRSSCEAAPDGRRRGVLLYVEPAAEGAPNTLLAK
jgi:hypothetical protein